MRGLTAQEEYVLRCVIECRKIAGPQLDYDIGRKLLDRKLILALPCTNNPCYDPTPDYWHYQPTSLAHLAIQCAIAARTMSIEDLL